jgi:CRISPR-associated protein Csc2
MSEGGEMRSSINELDHVLPEVTFPTIETLRDATLEGFIYVMGNLMRTRRYGAQESRTGTMTNHIIGIALCDGEIFSNLHFTQALYDAVKDDMGKPIDELRQIAAEIAQTHLANEPILKRQLIFGDQLEALITEVSGIYQDETKLATTISALYQQTKTYSETYGAFSGGKKGKK